ncbi:Cation efflux system protein CusC precursor [Roseovarius albus]|uniref:Cation efflux system protein CusC n=1 Tax=Roseovarius albus TaxID=1247867 RepID=A0A1X6YVZ0_9RHOB|nr:efflux transporter outer membrane subunit [Roseovarius albus]SLN32404.1 Cation efflux system protein CusC precursor [Roseovarius albus]
MKCLKWIPLAVALSACGDMGQYTEPEIDLPDVYSVIAPVKAPSRADTEWWLNFNDPVLNGLVARGLADNLSIAEAQARLKEAEANLRGARVAVTGDGTVEFSGRDPGQERIEASIEAQINLANEAGHRGAAAQARLEAAEDDEREAQRAVLAEISNAYTELRFFQTTRKRRAQDQASRQKTINDIQKQLNAGEATQLDLLRAQSLLAETESEIPLIESNIIRQRNRLATLLGRPVGLLNVDLGYKGHQPLPSGVTDPGIPADLLRARPDIQRAERLYAAAISDMSAANAARYPSLTLSGIISGGYNGPSAPLETILAGLVLPVFTQPALAAEVDAADARASQAYLQWRAAVIQAVEEVENAQALLGAAKRATRAAQRAVDLDQRSLALSRELVASGGNITVLDVLDRERSLASSRTSLAQSQRDIAIGYIELQSALGRGHPLTTEDLVKAEADDPEDEVARAQVDLQ